MYLKQAYFFLLVFLCAGPTAQADEQSKVASSALQNVLDRGELRVGVALYPPWAIQNEDGELRGFEIDVARQLADDLGVKPKFKVVVWDALVPTLTSGDVDIIASGFSITPDRALQVNFSQPYASSGTGLATNLSLTDDFESITNLNGPSVKIAVVTGTLSERLARSSFAAATFLSFDTADLATKALINGKAHAFVVANPVPRFIALRHPDKVDVPLEEPLLMTREAFAIRKGDADFLAYLNAWITARESDTWLKGHHDYWFKSLRWRAQADE